MKCDLARHIGNFVFHPVHPGIIRWKLAAAAENMDDHQELLEGLHRMEKQHYSRGSTGFGEGTNPASISSLICLCHHHIL